MQRGGGEIFCFLCHKRTYLYLAISNREFGGPKSTRHDAKELAEVVGAAESRSEKPTAGVASIAEAGGSGGQPLAIRRLKPRGATPQAVAGAPKKLEFLNREGVAGIAQPGGKKSPMPFLSV